MPGATTRRRPSTVTTLDPGFLPRPSVFYRPVAGVLAVVERRCWLAPEGRICMSGGVEWRAAGGLRTSHPAAASIGQLRAGEAMDQGA